MSHLRSDDDIEARIGKGQGKDGTGDISATFIQLQRGNIAIEIGNAPVPIMRGFRPVGENVAKQAGARAKIQNGD
jgi:hypothetical protein